MFAAEHTAFFSTFILYNQASLLTYLSKHHTSISQRQSSPLGPPIRLCMIIGMRGGSSRRGEDRPFAIPLPMHIKPNDMTEVHPVETSYIFY